METEVTRYGFHTESRLRETCTYGSMWGRAYPTGASRSTLHPSVYVLLYMLDCVAAVACVVMGLVKTRMLAYPPLAWEQLVASH